MLHRLLLYYTHFSNDLRLQVDNPISNKSLIFLESDWIFNFQKPLTIAKGFIFWLPLALVRCVQVVSRPTLNLVVSRTLADRVSKAAATKVGISSSLSMQSVYECCKCRSFLFLIFSNCFTFHDIHLQVFVTLENTCGNVYIIPNLLIDLF